MQRLVALAGALAFSAQAVAQADLEVEMTTCKVKRPIFSSLFVNSSTTLVKRGVVDVGGEEFAIYLPRERVGGVYSTDPRPKRMRLATAFTSTLLAVDQNRDGRIDVGESYYAEFPLRIGETMFDIVAIAEDGSKITLRRTDTPLFGGVIGRRAPDLRLSSLQGESVALQEFVGRVLVLDAWASG
ncbi:MAG: hypothetical protein VYE77_12435 [Planctomycetota bacterium]|nr:hypothetical protein [Planctomycetota bacterium]